MPPSPRVLLLSLFLCLVAACEVGPPPDQGPEPDVVSSTSQALSASCAGSCGGQAPSGCWCNEACEQYGDCCDDYLPVCAPEPSCEGSCGGESPDGCWCNAACEQYGDCCPDYQPVCVGESFPGLSNGALLSALRQQASNGHTPRGYTTARDYMYGRRQPSIDVINGLVEGVYTGVQEPADGTRSPGGKFATEHSWPKSDGADYYPVNGDIHHLFPSLTEANQRRSNYQFGDTTCSRNNCSWNEGGSELGRDSSNRTVFEVRWTRRGDIARAHFYVAMRYNKYISSAEEARLRAWHDQDPPDARERERNDAIEAVQGNRNPFVDEPSLVDRISNF